MGSSFENLVEFSWKSDWSTNKKIPGFIFTEKLVNWLRAQSAELSVTLIGP